MNHRGLRKQMAMGATVGEPVTIASMTTLAAAVIAMLKPFLLPGSKSEESALANAGKEGGMEIAENAAAADQGGSITEPGEAPPGAQTAAPAASSSSMSVKTGVDSQGQPQVTVEDVNHPAIHNAGEPGGGAAADVNPDESGAAAPGTNIADQLQDGIKKHWKAGLVIIGAGIVLYKAPDLIKSFKKGRR